MGKKSSLQVRFLEQTNYKLNFILLNRFNFIKKLLFFGFAKKKVK